MDGITSPIESQATCRMEFAKINLNMKSNCLPLTIGIISFVFGLISCNGQTKLKEEHQDIISFQEQFETFQNLGFTLNYGVDTSDINRWQNGHKDFEDRPYSLMYQTLGQTLEREPWTSITDKCWNVDLETIEKNGDYIDIMRHISRITNGELIFDNLQDYIDIEGGKAWISFNCYGDSYKWSLKVDGEWVDIELFDKVQLLAEKYQTKGRLTIFDIDGQDFVLGFYTKKELESIKQRTGLEIGWLE